MDASILNSLVLGVLGLVVFFYLLHTTVRSAVRCGIHDAQQAKDNLARIPAESVAGSMTHDV